KRWKVGWVLAGCLFAIPFLYSQRAKTSREWTVYGGSAAGFRYSDLKQINQSNVRQLQIAWTFDASDGPGTLETNHIIVNGVLYANTATHKVFALDAATGKQKWMFDSGLVGRGPNRAVAYWESGSD